MSFNHAEYLRNKEQEQNFKLAIIMADISLPEYVDEPCTFENDMLIMHIMPLVPRNLPNKTSYCLLRVTLKNPPYMDLKEYGCRCGNNSAGFKRAICQALSFLWVF